MLAFKPRWSLADACFRTPCGPSDRNIDGMPYFSYSVVDQKSRPDRNDAFSSIVIFFMISDLFISARPALYFFAFLRRFS